jgi:hypothetical protein
MRSRSVFVLGFTVEQIWGCGGKVVFIMYETEARMDSRQLLKQTRKQVGMRIRVMVMIFESRCTSLM